MTTRQGPDCEETGVWTHWGGAAAGEVHSLTCTALRYTLCTALTWEADAAQNVCGISV